MDQGIRKQNRAYTLRRLIILVLLAVFILFKLQMLIEDNPGNLQPFARFVLLMLVTIAALLSYPEYKYHRGFKQSTSDYLVLYFNTLQNLGRLGSSKAGASMVYFKAVAYILFGEVNNAMACLAEVDWSTQLPMYQARKYNAEALIHYLKTGKYAEGLALAEKAESLCEGNINLFNVINRRQSIYVNTGRILTGEDVNREGLNQLEKAFPFCSLMHKLIIAWALSYGYSVTGDSEKSRKYAEYIQSRAPHCTLLHQMPEQGR